jgi:PEP-CTERM motif
MRRLLRVSAAVLALAAATPGTARADSILVRDGGLSFDTNGPVLYGLTGEGLAIVGRFPAFATPLPCSPMPCAIGSPVNLGLVFGGQLTGFDLGLFFGDVLGTTYEFSEDNLLRGTFEFLTPDIVVPDTGEFFLTVTSPFTFSGQAAGFKGSSSVPLFNLNLRGQGRASMLLVGEQGSYDFRALSYVFTPAVVPEPATLILTGGGLAALWVRRRRHR